MLIDEPSLGLAPVAIEAVYAAIAKLRAESGATLVLVEENFTHIGGVADVVHILEAGKIVRSGSFERARRTTALLWRPTWDRSRM